MNCMELYNPRLKYYMPHFSGPQMSQGKKKGITLPATTNNRLIKDMDEIMLSMMHDSIQST